MSNEQSSNTSNNQPKSNRPQPPRRKQKPEEEGFQFNFFWIYAIIGAVLLLGLASNFADSSKSISFPEYKQMVLDNDVSAIKIIGQKNALVYLKDSALSKAKYEAVAKGKFGSPNHGPHYTFTIASNDAFDKTMAEFYKLHPEVKEVDVLYEEGKDWGNLIGWLLPLVIIVVLWIMMMRRMGGGAGGGMGGGNIFNIGKSRAILFDKGEKTDITFKDVAGLEEAKVEVEEIVSFLKEPQKYTKLGGKIPKGVLLVGPPGTGKTLIAKAMAGEAQVPFFSISGSEFVEMFVGVGASRVRDLFKQAREKAPCIIFIDEIDAIGRARGKTLVQSNDERESTLNQLLVEMDGFSGEKGVIMLAATNRPDVLDQALLRPGRFDRQISIDRPDMKGRAQIFKVHLQSIKTATDLDVEKLASQTPGFVGADIANICNEAALIAARKNKESVSIEDFNDAIDRVIGGLEKKNKIIQPDEKKIIAYHEAGHALCGWFLENAHPLVKVSIVPRGVAALGYAQYLPNEKYLETVNEMEDRMCMTMGGRAAEKVVFNKISTGAMSDLDTVTKMSYAAIAYYGMNDKVGNISFYDMANNSTFAKPYSEATSQMIDEEARKMIDVQYLRAQQLLIEKRELLDTLAKALLEKEVLFKDDLQVILGPRPFDKPEVAAEEPKTAPSTNVDSTDAQVENNPS
ncbi:MAG: ATP-dependent zinc metalloprotease FtsH [Chitinophagales bacterium]